jgi:hypothetical protein
MQDLGSVSQTLATIINMAKEKLQQCLTSQALTKKKESKRQTDRIETHRDGWTPERFQRARAASPSLLQLAGMPTIADPLSPTISPAKHNVLTP